MAASMTSEAFFHTLANFSWEEGAGDAIEFIKSHPNDISHKQKDGMTLIQTLLFGAYDPGEADKAIAAAVDLMDQETINATGYTGETALFTAVRLNRPQIYQLLLARNADATLKNEKQLVPLHSAAYIGLVEAIEALCTHDLSMTRAQDDEGLTPLDTACWKGHLEAVKLLVEKDRFPLDMTDHSGKSPLYTAVEHERTEIVEELLKYTCNLEKGDKDGATPLDCASAKGFKGIAEMLLKAGANLECTDNIGYTPLLTACALDKLALVELFIGAGANTMAKTTKRQTGLMRACRYGFTQVASRLLQEKTALEQTQYTDDDSDTALLIACRYGHAETVLALLKAGANVSHANESGRTPLMEASKWRYLDIVQILLSHDDHARGGGEDAIVDQKNERHLDNTALLYATWHGHVQVVELLVKYGANPDGKDSNGRTALHQACRQGYKEVVELLCRKVKDINAVDQLGYTAIHHASWDKFDDESQLDEDDMGHDPYLNADELTPVPGKYAEIIQHLIRKGIDPWFTAVNGKTALHSAAESGYASRVAILLGSRRQKENLHIQDQTQRTALGIAIHKQHLDVVRQLLLWMDTADFGDVDDEEDLLIWLANRQETHELLCLVLSKHHDNIKYSPPSSKDWTALEWATYRGYPKLVWWLLFSSNPSLERDRRISAAERIAKSFIPKRAERGRALDIKGDDSKDGRPDHKQADVLSKSIVSEDGHLQVVQILRNPPMTQTAGPKQQLKQVSDGPAYLSQSMELMTTYMAEMVDFYQFKGRSGFLRRFASVKDVVYVRGPVQIMTDARERTHKLDSQFGPSNGLAGTAWDEDNIDVRWIHLPANNMKWMSDLALTISADLKVDSRGLSWLEQSGDQVLGKNRASRFMKPKCVYRVEPGDDSSSTVVAGSATAADSDDSSTGDSNSDSSDSDDSNDEADNSQMAVYMPYLTLATHRDNPQEASPNYYLLLSDYRESIIHGTRTLDEFYYHACEEENLRSDILDRNKDQVLSKTIHGSMGDLDSWVLLNVDQLWIWVVSEKTIITSTTHRKDGDEDPLLKAVLGALTYANESGAKSRGPTDALQLSRLIVDACVGFFDREFNMNVSGADGSEDTEWKGSIHDVFTNSIAQAALREAALYNRFASDEQSGLSVSSGWPKASLRRMEILEAAKLFREIKDIRDELKMLKTVAEHQINVQREAPDLGTSTETRFYETRSSEAIVHDLEDMDVAAARIETAVNTTLTLEQNEISIAQAQESVSQGRTLMLFTVVTILFLPLSFFTSFFALDVASFEQTPAWTFVAIFSVSFVFFAPLTIFAFYSESITALYHRLFADTKRDRAQVRPSRNLPPSPTFIKPRETFQTATRVFSRVSKARQ